MLDDSELYQNLEFEAAHQRIDKNVEINAQRLAQQHRENSPHMQQLGTLLAKLRRLYTVHAFQRQSKQFRVHFFLASLVKAKEQKLFKA